VSRTPWREQLGALEAGGPWFAAWRDIGRQLASSLGDDTPLHEALNLHGGAAVRFVPQQDLPPGIAYEQHIALTGCCPTRENLHDFFNGIVWLQLPRAKRQLNRVQATQLAAQGARGARGAARDAATLFDESGALLDAPAPLWEALLGRNWQRLFVELRPLWAQARVLVFGHALLEKLVQPRKDLTAHVWRAPCAISSLGDVDRWLESELTAERLAGKPFTPLQLLGVPGWWPQNEVVSFYDDPRVFRAPAGRPMEIGSNASP
jgi:hypothetical protein